MAQNVNVNLYNSQLNKWKLGIKNDTKVTLKRSSNVNAQALKICKAFAIGSSANIKLSKHF